MLSYCHCLSGPKSVSSSLPVFVSDCSTFVHRTSRRQLKSLDGRWRCWFDSLLAPGTENIRFQVPTGGKIGAKRAVAPFSTGGSSPG